MIGDPARQPHEADHPTLRARGPIRAAQGEPLRLAVFAFYTAVLAAAVILILAAFF